MIFNALKLKPELTQKNLQNWKIFYCIGLTGDFLK